ncbi:MAG: RNA methyltransferase, partial [Beijerinckiaceae bacterium]
LAASLMNLRKPIAAQLPPTLGALDIDLRGSVKVAAAPRLRLLDVSAMLDLARLSLHGDIIAEWRKPSLQMGKALVTPPPGGFLQATSAGEEKLARLVRDGVGAAKRIADLFSGCGTFSLRLAESAHVRAVEFDKAAIDALTRAARGAAGLKPVTAETRDLFRRPMTPQELDLFDAVTIDPPRAGAEAQARMLAKTRRLGAIVMASCNPATFARDARILVDGGFSLARVTPVDHFRHSAHVELVAVFRR